MEFILKVLGSNLVIVVMIILWIFGSFFTFKNYFTEYYHSFKELGLDEDRGRTQMCFGIWGEVYFNKTDKIACFFITFFFFPLIWVYVILKFIFCNVGKLLYVAIKNGFVVLDKIVPEIEIKKKE